MNGQVIECISEMTFFLPHVNSELIVVQFGCHIPVTAQVQVSPFCAHGLSHGSK